MTSRRGGFEANRCLVMYEIKCIIDLLLDTTENLTDGVLNAIGLNLALSGQTAKTTCLLGGGLC